MKLIAFFFLIFYGISLSEVRGENLIVWNVGQGLWITISSAQECAHFDMGGEKVDWRKVIAECGHKENRAYFSHWDSDHISFANLASHKLRSFCVASFPGGPASDRKLAIFSHFSKCEDDSVTAVKVNELKFTPTLSRGRKVTNEFSKIYVADKALMPGDSNKKEERVWLQVLPSGIRTLVLGHHGSRTATSENLLRALPTLRLAIASARKHRYGHPHKETLDRLKNFGVAVLSTEQWNNIFIELE